MVFDEVVVRQTKAWLRQVVIGLNFCPFAAREVQRDSIHYEVVREQQHLYICLERVLLECRRLDEQPEIETTLLVFPDAFADFQHYLDLLDVAETLLYDCSYEGIYQLASFHPAYRFAGADEDDPANFTNRSPYPMLHLLREASLEKALAHYPNPEDIPERNIEVARQRGLAHMQLLLAACFSAGAE